ncbi:Transcription factor spt8 [Coemansia sp. RSA 552]|nr:Transcription factor spt8 [Coemansia sp. RSA 552]
MSDAAFNDDLLEKELFGGADDDDELGAMDVDGMMGLDDSMAGLGGAGELTVLHHAPRIRASASAGLDRCRTYDILPTMAFINQVYAPGATVNAQVYTVTATANMRWVFTGGDDGYIKKWDFNATVNGKQQLTQGQRHPHVDSVTKAGVLASFWDHGDTGGADAGTDVLSPVFSLDVQSEAMWLVSGMRSGRIGLWSVRHDEGRRIALLDKHKKPVSVLRITPDELGLVSGAWDRAVLYWDLNTGKLARAFAGHTSQISAIEFRPTWNYERFKDLQQEPPDAPAPGEPLDSKSAEPVLMTTSIDGQCLLWDVRAPRALPLHCDVPAKTPPWATAACWSHDGRYIYVGRRNNTVDEYEFGMGSQPVRTLRLPMNSGPVTALATMSNGRSLICASYDNVRMWDLRDPPAGQRRSTIPFQIIPGHHGGTVSAVLVDESSRYMLTTPGTRGWDGSSNAMFLGYEINPIA